MIDPEGSRAEPSRLWYFDAAQAVCFRCGFSVFEMAFADQEKCGFGFSFNFLCSFVWAPVYAFRLRTCGLFYMNARYFDQAIICRSCTPPVKATKQTLPRPARRVHCRNSGTNIRTAESREGRFDCKHASL